MKEDKAAVKEENEPQSPSDTENAEARTPENGDDADSGDKFELDETSSNSDGTRPKGVLVIHSKLKNRTKKSVQWRTEDELEMHHFFELDETERGTTPASNSIHSSTLLRWRWKQFFFLKFIHFHYLIFISILNIH